MDNSALANTDTSTDTHSEIRREHQNFMVSGRILFETVTALRKQGDALIETEENPCFDFREVTRTDSSAVALLLAWLRKAKGDGKAIRFINLPQSMLDMAQAYDVRSFLGISS
jgi:phospholipid transport system transporter-binding protein